MDSGTPITAAIFLAFIKCPTKAYLLAIGEHAPGAYFADIEARIASLHKAAAKGRPRVGAEVAELSISETSCVAPTTRPLRMRSTAKQPPMILRCRSANREGIGDPHEG